MSNPHDNEFGDFPSVINAGFAYKGGGISIVNVRKEKEEQGFKTRLVTGDGPDRLEWWKEK